MRTVPPGTAGSFSMIVAPEHLASRFKDSTLPPVLATPVMIMMMENAALNALKPFFEPGESALGTVVDIRHLAATPVGRQVSASARVIAVEGRRVLFEVEAHQGEHRIGEGRHERVIIDNERFAARLAAQP
jgi:fluoroacetyl-CoA thioesterase